MTPPEVERSAIDGLLFVDLAVHRDGRGWFKENWQRAAMVAAGVPDFGPVQHNVAYNDREGVTRGVHAEPWDKFVSLVAGEIFGAWVDLRPGPAFGTVVTRRIRPETAVFVPRGVGNSYQTLQPGTAYSYLVNRHWSREAVGSYTFVNLADETLAIPWPLALDAAEVSEADRTHPRLAEVTPMTPLRTVILGAGGQVGRALARILPQAHALTRAEFDLADSGQVAGFDWDGVSTVINAAAYTAVDLAETPEGRRDAWATNVTGVARLVEACRANQIRLVHLSSDYVFDGTAAEHPEDEPFSPLGVYGQTKAAGDVLVGTWQRHYIVRTSWVIGDGKNFVRTMADLAARGVSPSVVNDQVGRLTFADDLAAGIAHLLSTDAPFGTYNLTNTGPVQSWADIAADVFELCGRDPADVRPVSTEEYAGGRNLAPRPERSPLALDAITGAGFVPGAARERLAGIVRPS
ncbi:MAG TPA: sugar nucleotide-binding protein [Dermatophilaceae bacterium]|nr:sugar nucleotide-binding protein [Dermatophilaceae bacterium]